VHDSRSLTVTEFDKLNRQVPTLIKQNDGKVPKLYIKTIADLETVMLEAIEKQKVTPKKMNAINQRGFNAVRQRIRKNNKDYTKDIELYRADKEEFMREEVVEEVVTATKRPKRSMLEGGETISGADDGGFTLVGAGGKAMQYTPESILKHLRTIFEARGRKNTDRIEQIRVMEKLLDVATTDYQRVRVLLTLIPTRFDLTSGTGNQMSQEQWKL
jgi:translation initiation factor 3 subunit C